MVAGGLHGGQIQTPIHFILGTGRCGSTLLHEVLCQHPSVSFLSNLEDRSASLGMASRLNGPVYRLLPPSFTQKGRMRFAPSEGYAAFAREVSPAFANSSRDLLAGDATPWLASRFAGFLQDRADRQGKPVFLHKFTGWPRAGFVHEVLPEARFVHVIRDGRAVANSWLQMPWWLGYQGPLHWNWGGLPSAYQAEWEDSGRSFVVLAGLAWKLLIDAAERARAKLPEGVWLDVRYEDFIAEPEATTRILCEFLGMPPSKAFQARLRAYNFDPSRTQAFVRDLGPSALGDLEAVTGEHLQRYGYSAS